mmetsp:Transcript_49110/g.98828  ORF Transcript_49110/g.98828 Transcript_49110/m.98828 type:complete len:87 (-) Transcript_49110:322-582(-)
MNAARIVARSSYRVALPKQAQPKRNMAGDMGVKKNYFVEEWNGRREITEKTFEYDKETVPWLLATAGFFVGVYMMSKGEGHDCTDL